MLIFTENIFKIYDKKYQLIYNFKNIDAFFNYTFYRVVYFVNKYLYLLYNEKEETYLQNNYSKKQKQ